ncbi:bifunctional DNA primase/polymerase [Polymorphospora sp. NPDC051019]|uniref:bifunctional DNA primase/polymerase n=1 Tax=Polymorphospora sp. NPDC051019 TaxID=3155725 RepID=UPI003412DC9D
MRWTLRPFPTLDRLRLRRAADRFAERGWPVTPGAYLAGRRFTCDRAGCPTTGCHPADEHWERTASADRGRISRWWRRRPHAVLLATGHTFDALEVPASLGLRVLGATRLHAGLGSSQLRVRGPVAVTPTARWMFLVRPGDPLRPELEESLDVVRHGPGSWVPAPPTRLPEGPVRWMVAPHECRWRLPDSYAVQAMLVDALGPPRPALRALARQPSTLHNAA